MYLTRSNVHIMRVLNVDFSPWCIAGNWPFFEWPLAARFIWNRENYLVVTVLELCYIQCWTPLLWYTLCVFIYSVDSQPPVITCPPGIDQLVNCGTPNAQVLLKAEASDDCGAASIVYSSTGSTIFSQQTQNSQTMNVGVSQVTATATDNSGRQSTCVFTVTIRTGNVQE